MISSVRAEDLNHVESLMKETCLNFSSGLLRDILLWHLETGGKRLRARLALSVGSIYGVKKSDLIPWAAACELLHNATLIHDDIQDEDQMRRGHSTVWVKFGIPQAINAGDIMMFLPQLILPDECLFQKQLRELLSQRMVSTIQGQSFEQELIDSIESVDLSDRYLKCIAKKTSALFELPVRGSLILARESEENVYRIARIFREMGVVFQIQDDVLDIFGDKGRGFVAGDLREGKVSALVVSHLKRNPHEAKRVAHLLTQPRESVSEREIEELIQMWRTDGAALQEVLSDLQVRVDEMRVQTANLGSITSLVEELTTVILKPISHLMVGKE